MTGRHRTPGLSASSAGQSSPLSIVPPSGFAVCARSKRVCGGHRAGLYNNRRPHGPRTHRNVFEPYSGDSRISYIVSEPAVGIGQLATLIQTPGGNILRDCITLLDDDIVHRIEQLRGLRAIVISHPHFCSAHVQWTRVFGCPVYLASDDIEWKTMRSPHQVLVTETETDVLDTGVKIIKLGGHFPGSMVLLYDRHVFIADTLMITPAGFGNWSADALGEPRQRPFEQNSFAFLWSYPNRIPLGLDEIARMWSIIRSCDFEAAHGSFAFCDMGDVHAKARLLYSMQIQFVAWDTRPTRC